MKRDTPANLSFIEPMNPLRVRELPVGNWIYELKFDGYRALAFKADKEVRLVSRNRTVFNNDYPQLIDSLKLLTAKAATIDGEIAALDQNGDGLLKTMSQFSDNVRSIVFEGIGHHLPEECPEEMTKAILEFWGAESGTGQ